MAIRKLNHGEANSVAVGAEGTDRCQDSPWRIETNQIGNLVKARFNNSSGSVLTTGNNIRQPNTAAGSFKATGLDQSETKTSAWNQEINFEDTFEPADCTPSCISHQYKETNETARTNSSATKICGPTLSQIMHVQAPERTRRSDNDLKLSNPKKTRATLLGATGVKPSHWTNNTTQGTTGTTAGQTGITKTAGKTEDRTTWTSGITQGAMMSTQEKTGLGVANTSESNFF